MRFRRRSKSRKRLLRRLLVLSILASAVGYPAAEARSMEGAMFSDSFSRVQYVPGLYDAPEDELVAAGDYVDADLEFVVRTNREYRVCPFTNERYYMYRPAGMS